MMWTSSESICHHAALLEGQIDVVDFVPAAITSSIHLNKTRPLDLEGAEDGSQQLSN